MKLIFLDIDGVMVSKDSIMKNKDHPLNKWRIDSLGEEHINQLNYIIRETDAKIVISSTWRDDFSSVGWSRYFSSVGIIGEVFVKLQN